MYVCIKGYTQDTPYCIIKCYNSCLHPRNSQYQSKEVIFIKYMQKSLVNVKFCTTITPLHPLVLVLVHLDTPAYSYVHTLCRY